MSVGERFVLGLAEPGIESIGSFPSFTCTFGANRFRGDEVGNHMPMAGDGHLFSGRDSIELGREGLTCNRG